MVSKLCFALTRSFYTKINYRCDFNKLPRTCFYAKNRTKWTSSVSLIVPKVRIRYCTTAASATSGGPTSSYPCLTDEKSIRNFLVGLNGETRDMLQREMECFEEERMAEQLAMDPNTSVTNQQLWKVFLFNGVPFIGFGLLDNVIMIIAGEYIDATIGAALGISTMAAAALGNLISDLAGVGTAGYVEALASRCGIQPPDMTPTQAFLNKTRYMVALGRAVGVTLGCLLGMFPLLFFDSGREDKEVKIEVKGATTIEQAAQTDPASVKPK